MLIATKTVHEVNHSELDRAVSEFFGAPYSVVLAEELDNDSSATAEVVGSELSDYKADQVKQWKKSGMEGHSPRLSVVLDFMVRSGAIPAGSYLINVSW